MFIAIIANILVGPVLYYFIDWIVRFFTKFKAVEKMYNKYVGKLQKKIHDKVERYGEIGVAIFIGLPLPGSGVYSGAIGSYVIGLSKKKFFYATVIGVLIAAAAVSLICYFISTGIDSGFFDMLIKR